MKTNRGSTMTKETPVVVLEDPCGRDSGQREIFEFYVVDEDTIKWVHKVQSASDPGMLKVHIEKCGREEARVYYKKLLKIGLKRVVR